MCAGKKREEKGEKRERVREREEGERVFNGGYDMRDQLFFLRLAR